ncbi:unnamed protein product [Caenorhabditis bovis]|uniref:Metalloendopeptidase n=1 Tax=Caenorhabditis bovis TaxID=2654633 RepID=A0A8S1EJA6_9PELO|nr:unnamed protein product [Caenorhabditis bovis]
MACQTGIRANAALKNALNLGKQAKLRLIKIVVNNEEMTPNYEYAGTTNWRDDWRACLPECVDAFEPCFILFRLNTITEWVLITFVDDRAPVREKMLLAATCATFKSEFGQCYIEHEKHVTDRKDLTLEAFESWLKAKTELGPMSDVERELHNAQQERAAIAHAGPQHMKGVAFPVDRNAEEALKQLARGQLSFVQLSVDTLNEAIKLEGIQEHLEPSALASKVPRDKPRYTFYNFDHTWEGVPQKCTLFIYSLPSSGSSIKERMLYSSCKGPFLSAATNSYGIVITTKMEVDARDDLSEKALLEVIHPLPVEAQKQFARPAPPRAGPRRITKGPKQSYAYLMLLRTIIFLFALFANIEPNEQENETRIRFRRYFKASKAGRIARAATARKERIWPEGIIPFVITSNFSGDHQHLFLRAMRHWENYTCVSFVPKEPHHKHYITFTVDKCGCCSYVGRRGEGPQAISIGKNCDKFGIVVHELGHVVGFWHEHTRPDRDLYVDIFYKSIQTGQDYNFEKSKPEEVDSLGEPYDFSSIMHYARDTFSRGAFHDTILPKPSSGFRSEIGQRIQLSEGDIRQTKKLYKCADCGGTLMQESGNLIISHPGKCVWHIIAPLGHTIFLNITDQICGGDDHYRTIASSTNRMLIEARLVAPSPLPFATYYAICGGPIYANHGVIQSPKYPESYPPNSDCQWTIHVEENSQVAIEIVYFHLEHHKECIYDRLILTEGAKPNELSETLCGLVENKTIITKSNQVAMRFFSDNSVQKTGFEIRFSKELNECATDKNNCQHYCVNIVGGFRCECRVGFSLSKNGYSCESTCGGYLRASNGSISSPNFPRPYPSSKTCIWEIEADDGYHIFLNFTKFNVEGMRTECAYDYVKIGDNEKLCGEYNEPLLFTTPTNKVRIEFSSDLSVERDGFFANFIADFDECQYDNAGCEHSCQNRLGSYVCTCNSGFVLSEDKHNCKEGSCFFELNAPSGEISSPSFPNDYPKSQNCSWHFVTTPGHRLMLTFSTFQVEEHSQCKYDAVAVYDGGDSQSPLAGLFCGLTPPPLLLSSLNEFFLTFTSDASVSRKGFEAQYTSVCGGSLIAESLPGHIYSHATFSDSKYGKNQDCSWRVSAKTPSRGVRLQFSSFQLEGEDGCLYDYIEIYDGPEMTPDSLFGRFCGDAIPETFTSSGSEMLLIMHTDNAEEEKGFVGEYREAQRANRRKIINTPVHPPRTGMKEPINEQMNAN